MTKAQLISKLISETSLSKKDITTVLDAFISTTTKALLKGDTIQLPPLGRFKVKQLKARIARNPKTGEKITLNPKKKITFTPSKKLKDILLK